MFHSFDGFDEAFPQSTSGSAHATAAKPLRRRKTLGQQIVFWGTNALVMSLAAICYLTICAEGLRQLVGVMATRLYSTPIPGAGLLRQYDGWNRLDLAMVASLVLLTAVGCLWVRIFTELMGHGQWAVQKTQSPVLFVLLSTIAVILIGGDAAIFYLGLQSKVASSWSETPSYVPAVVTIVYMAGLALLGAWHADYKTSGTV